MPLLTPKDAKTVRVAIQRLAQQVHEGGTPEYASIELTDLAASRLVGTNASKVLVSVSNLASWIAGVANEIDVTDDTDGTITIGIVNPVIVGKGGTGVATLTDHGILLGSGTDVITPLGVATNGQLPIGYTGADPVLATLTEGEGINITNAAGSITIAGEDATVTNKGIASFADVDFTVTSGAVTIDDSGIDHDVTTNFVADEHIGHTGVSISAGTGLTGGGTIASTRTLALSHLGIESLADPDADKIFFWDDSAGASKFLAVSTGLQISTTNLTTKDSEIVHDSLSGFVSDEHIVHSDVSVLAGTGMSGGGTIAANRTLTCTITQYTDALARTACIAASISDGDLTHSPDGNSVFDALVLKSPIASPTFTGTVTLPATTIIPDGGTIGQATGPLIAFDDTLNYLEITGCNVGIGTTTPAAKIHTYTNTTGPTSEYLGYFENANAAGETALIVFSGMFPYNFINIMTHGVSFLENYYPSVLSATTDAGKGMVYGQGLQMTEFLIGIVNNRPLSFFTNNLIRLSIAADGNVTIGSLAGILKGTAGVVSGGATHADLASIDSNQHIDHTGVSISPGTGMSGGGTIAANRTLTCDITQYTDALARAAISETITGLDYTSATGVLSLTTGYVIPTTTQETNWGTAYTHSQVAGGNSVHVSVTENTNWDTAYTHSGLTTGNPHQVTKSDVGLGSVENTALSTWVGTTNITTLGTISTVGNITIANGGTIGQAAGPLLTFDDTLNYLEITGCNVGIGTATPVGKFEVITGNNFGLVLRNTTDEPTYLDMWCGGAGSVYDIVNPTAGWGHQFYVDGVEKVRIDDVGDVSIGIVAAASAQLHIDQSSTTGAQPVLLLDQGDVSEEFIRFIGTSANTVLTQSIIEAADVATATIAGYLKIFIQDDGNQLTDQAYFMPVYTLT